MLIINILILIFPILLAVAFFLFLFLFLFFLFVVNFVIHWNEKALGSHVFQISFYMSNNSFHNNISSIQMIHHQIT